MMKLISTVVVAVLSGCSATAPVQPVADAGSAARFEPGSNSNNFDCDVAPGRYTELNTPVSGANFSITGVMKILALRADSTWPPDAGVVFAGTNKLPRVGLETFVLADKPAVLQIAIRGAGDGADHTVFASVPISASQIAFTLRVSGSGQVSLSVGESSTSLSVGPIEISRMNFYCSSAHVRFSEVQMRSEK